MDFPHYSYPPGTVLGLAASVLFGRRRSFRADGQACLTRLEPPLSLLGAENVPTCGPCLITFNHYYRSGFNAWWMALAIAATVPIDIHFVMTGELTYPGKWYAPLGMTLSRALLRRLSKIYGFTSMPPMPPRPKDVRARARSVRVALAHAKEHPHAILGLAPEGGDQPGGVLNWPPSGAGRFLALLEGAGFPILPVGVYEEAGKLCLQFGKPFRLHLPGGGTSAERDRAAAQVVMTAIARLVPVSLRGEFGAQS
jgi:hypothetical protein